MSQLEQTDAGSVKLSDKIIQELVFSAVKDIKGLILVKKGLFRKCCRFIFGIKYPGVKVKLKRQNQVTIQIKAFVRFGFNIPEVAHQVQNTAKAALAKSIDVQVNKININILGIERG